MACSEKAAGKIRRILAGKRGITEKKMFGGLAFLSRGRMVCGVLGDDLVVRVRREDTSAYLAKPHVRPMDFTGQPLSGLLYVAPGGFRTEARLRAWVERGVGVASSAGTKTSPAKRRAVRRGNRGAARKR